MRFFAPGAAFCGLAVLASSASALNDVQIHFVDGRELPVAGLDVFVHDADGSLLVSELGAGASVLAHDVGAWITVELPSLGSKLDIPMLDFPESQVTLRVSRSKGLSGVLSIKPVLGPAWPASSFAGGAANDDCVNAIPIADGDTVFTTVGASTDGTVGSNFNEIWFTYTASCSGTVTISTCNQADYDSDLLLLTASSTCAAQSALAINDDASGCAANTSVLVAPVTAGQTYLLSVGGFSSADTGSGTISITCTASLPNDDCANAQLIVVDSSTTFDNSINTTVASDPAFSCHFTAPAQGFGTTWFRFVATDTAVLLDTTDSTGSDDTLIGVYDGSCGSLVEIACGEDADFAGLNFLTEVCATGLVVGTEYLVQVASFGTASLGSITLDLSSAPLVAERIGSGINTATLSASGPAIIGKDFNLTIGPGAASTAVFFSGGPSQFLFPPFGEVLINPSIFLSLAAPTGSHVLPVPDKAGLVGAALSVQGFDFGSLSPTNAIDFVIGSF